MPGPCFDVFAETKADVAIAVTIFYDESADESVWCGLEMMLDGNLDPTDDFFCDACDEGGLTVGACGKGFDPGHDVGR